MTTNAERAASGLRGDAHRHKSAERRQQALTLFESGLSYRKVGLEMGLCKSRAGQLICHGRKERAYLRITTPLGL